MSVLEYVVGYDGVVLYLCPAVAEGLQNRLYEGNCKNPPRSRQLDRVCFNGVPDLSISPVSIPIMRDTGSKTMARTARVVAMIGGGDCRTRQAKTSVFCRNWQRLLPFYPLPPCQISLK